MLYANFITLVKQIVFYHNLQLFLSSTDSLLFLYYIRWLTFLAIDI
jgi:hypothetical protein